MGEGAGKIGVLEKIPSVAVVSNVAICRGSTGTYEVTIDWLAYMKV